MWGLHVFFIISVTRILEDPPGGKGASIKKETKLLLGDRGAIALEAKEKEMCR